MQTISITIPQNRPPRYVRRCMWMTAGLVVALVLCAVRWAEYVAYLEGAARV